jgi:hypothetical protein
MTAGVVHVTNPTPLGVEWQPYAMMKWLSYGNDSKHPQADQGFMQRREFCFTLEVGLAPFEARSSLSPLSSLSRIPAVIN